MRPNALSCVSCFRVFRALVAADRSIGIIATEEISWLMKYARGIEWKASERNDADKAAEKKTTDQ